MRLCYKIKLLEYQWATSTIACQRIASGGQAGILSMRYVSSTGRLKDPVSILAEDLSIAPSSGCNCCWVVPVRKKSTESLINGPATISARSSSWQCQAPDWCQGMIKRNIVMFILQFLEDVYVATKFLKACGSAFWIGQIGTSHAFHLVCAAKSWMARRSESLGRVAYILTHTPSRIRWSAMLEAPGVDGRSLALLVSLQKVQGNGASVLQALSRNPNKKSERVRSSLAEKCPSSQSQYCLTVIKQYDIRRLYMMDTR